MTVGLAGHTMAEEMNLETRELVSDGALLVSDESSRSPGEIALLMSDDEIKKRNQGLLSKKLPPCALNYSFTHTHASGQMLDVGDIEITDKMLGFLLTPGVCELLVAFVTQVESSLKNQRPRRGMEPTLALKRSYRCWMHPATSVEVYPATSIEV